MSFEIKNVRDISYDDAEKEIYNYILRADHYVNISELAEELNIDLTFVIKVYNKIYGGF